MKELENIRVHMRKGCLSGIQPGRGTNRNEELHKNLNSIMSSSRYGVELAYGLFTECFFKHNERMLSKVEQRAENPLEFYRLLHRETVLTSEKFGLQFRDNNTSPTASSKLSIDSCSFQQAYEMINGISIQHTKEMLQVNMLPEDKSPVEVTDMEGTTSHCVDDLCMSVSELKSTLMTALSWYFSSIAINKASETASIDMLHVPFMTNSLDSLFNPMKSATSDKAEQAAHEQRLSQVLKAWNFLKCPSPMDGNCLFYSIVHNLRFQVQNGNAELGTFMNDCCGTNIIEKSYEESIAILRQLVVAEWLGEYSNEYQKFLTGNQLQEQARQFLKNGEFSSEIGDLVIAAMSNVIKAPIVILTSAENMPVVIQHPTHSPILNMDPLFLAYTQFGSGHYNPVLPTVQVDLSTGIAQHSQPSQSRNEKGCTCGRKSIKGTPCSFDISQYSCRCPCYNEKHACQLVCKCRNCANPFGTRPIKDPPQIGQKRKREPHLSQSTPLKGKKSMSFMKDMGEQVTTGGFSNMEYLVVSSLIQHLLAQDGREFVREDVQCLSTSKLHQLYSSIVSLTQELGLEFALYERTHEEIQKLSKKLLFKCEIVYQHHLM